MSRACGLRAWNKLSRVLCVGLTRFRGMRFEPMGPTSNPSIPETTSILDYVARYLELRFIRDRDQMRFEV